MRPLFSFTVLLHYLPLPITSITVEFSKRQETSNNTLPAPIVAESSQHWEGVDGAWSTFTIRIGTPASTYRVLPVSSWQETWVVYGSAAGVCNTSIGVEEKCQEERGGVFDVNKSESWKDGGQHPLGLDEELGFKGVGQYGFDTVGLGYSNATGPTLPNQIVSAIVTNDYWFGILGLGFQPTNFSGYDNPQPSFAESLFTQGRISSRSWSYTAGAYYRLKSVFGSLIFGGYDASRFVPNNVTFTMTGDNLKDVVVTIRSIVSTTETGNQTLMGNPEFAFIDSAVSELWLPTSVCEAFEQAFGLKLDNASGLYLLDNSTHSKLRELNPNITITLANQKIGGGTTDIVFSYAAFDLSISPPLLPNRTSWYFPIRRGEEGKFVLGRTFLQEAYVTTHYGSRTFNVSQCVYEDGLKSHVVALPETLPTNSGSTSDSGSGSGSGSKSSKKKLGTGAIVGIVIGVLALFFILALLLSCLRRKKKKKQLRNKFREERGSSLPSDAVEIDSGKRVEKPGKWQTAHGEQASSFMNEVPGNDAKVEIEGNPIMVPQELEAEVPITPNGIVGNDVVAHGRTPMAELGSANRGLEYGGNAEERREEDGIVSPNTEANRNSMVGPGGIGGRTSILISTPTDSEGRWSPTTPVQRVGTGGSRFQERWN